MEAYQWSRKAPLNFPNLEKNLSIVFSDIEADFSNPLDSPINEEIYSDLLSWNKYKKDIICLMPTNLYGDNDNFDITSSHVIPGLISKFLLAKKNKLDVKIWGSGKPIREFLHVKDLVEAILILLKSKIS